MFFSGVYYEKKRTNERKNKRNIDISMADIDHRAVESASDRLCSDVSLI